MDVKRFVTDEDTLEAVETAGYLAAVAGSTYLLGYYHAWEEWRPIAPGATSADVPTVALGGLAIGVLLVGLSAVGERWTLSD